VPFDRCAVCTDTFGKGEVTTRWVEAGLADGALKDARAPLATPAGTRQGNPVRLVVEVDGRRVPVSVWGDEVRTPPPPPAHAGLGFDASGGGSAILAPMQGTILQVVVEPGQAVAAGDVVCILEAMKMENDIATTRDGTVTEVAVSKGDVVEIGQRMILVE